MPDDDHSDYEFVPNNYPNYWPKDGIMCAKLP